MKNKLYLLLTFSPIFWLIGFFLSILCNLNWFKKRSLVSLSSFVYSSELGEYSRIFNGVILRRSEVGKYSYIAPKSNIVNTKIGNYCSIGPNVQICLGLHPLNFFSTHPCFYDQGNFLYGKKSPHKFNNVLGSVTIGNDVWIGANVIILDNLTIGDGAVIAAGAVVTKNIKPFSIVVGVPAMHLRFRLSKEDRATVTRSNWWNDSPDMVDFDLLKNIK